MQRFEFLLSFDAGCCQISKVSVRRGKARAFCGAIVSSFYDLRQHIAVGLVSHDLIVAHVGQLGRSSRPKRAWRWGRGAVDDEIADR